MGDSGPRRAEAGAAQGNLLAATGSVHPAGLNVQIRGCGPPERGARGGRPLPDFVGGGPPRMRGLYRYTVCKRNIQQRARTDRPLVAPFSFGGGRSRGGRVALALRVGLRKGGARGGKFVSLPAGGLLFRIAGPAREELAQTSLERRRLFLASLRALRARGGRGGAHNTAFARGSPHASVGFLSKYAPSGSGRRVSALRAGGTSCPPSAGA